MSGLLLGSLSDALAQDEVEPISRYLLPKNSPVTVTNGSCPDNPHIPLYDCYNLNAYLLDQAGLDNPLLIHKSAFHHVVQLMMTFNGMWNRMVLYFNQEVLASDLIKDIRSEVGDWVSTLYDQLLDKLLITAIFVLGIVLVVSFLSTGQISGTLFQWLLLLSGFAILTANMTTVLNWTGNLERVATDAVMIAYTEVIGEEQVPATGEEKQETLANSRDEALVRMGEIYWKNFHHFPWQLGEFGMIPIPEYKDGKPHYSAKEKEVIKDTKTMLSLNTLKLEDWEKRKSLVEKWTEGASMFDKFYNSAVPDDFEVPDQPKYISMTSEALVQRTALVSITLLASLAYGGMILVLSFSAIVAEVIVYLAALVAPFLLFTAFIPMLGRVVFIRWLQVIGVASTYKVILSFLILGALGITELLSWSTTNQIEEHGLIIAFVIQIAIFLAVLVFHRWILATLMGPMKAINQISSETAKSAKDIGVGGALAVAGAGLAAMTGNPRLATRGARKVYDTFAGLKDRLNPKASSESEQAAQSSIKDRSPQFVPDDFSTTTGEKGKENPYEADSREAQLFDDMQAKGFNPYAEKDRESYSQQHLAQQTGDEWKANKAAINNISDDSREFARRQKKNERMERRAALNERLDQIEQEAMRRAEEREKENSKIHRMKNAVRNRIWGDK